MAKFLYKAKNDQGDVVSGTVQASNEVEAEKILFNNKLIAMDILPEKGVSLSNYFEARVTVKDRAVFSRQLATMISAGLTLNKAMSILAAQAKNEKLKRIFLEIFRDLEDGLAFSSALSKHPDAFDRVYVSIVKSGETTGNLDVVLDQMAVRLENDSDFIGKIRSAMYYPIFILIALIGVGTYMLVAVIPQLQMIFERASVRLPFATRVVIWLSGFILTKWWLIIIVLAILVFVIRSWAISEKGSRTLSLWQIELPVIKGFSVNIYMSRFARVLEMLVRAGVPLLDALKVSSTTMNNHVYEDSINLMALEVEKGVPLSVPIQRDENFPKIIGQMIAVGEQTGKLDEVLEKVAIYFERESENKIKAISTLIEPIILLIIGFAVAFLIFAVLLPIYNIAQFQ